MAAGDADRRVLRPGETIEYEESHPRDKMNLLNITEDDVRATLEAPDRTRPARRLPGVHPCIIYLRRRDGERICKVYVREGSEPMRVATVAWHGE